MVYGILFHRMKGKSIMFDKIDVAKVLKMTHANTPYNAKLEIEYDKMYITCGTYGSYVYPITTLSYFYDSLEEAIKDMQLIEKKQKLLREKTLKLFDINIEIEE